MSQAVIWKALIGAVITLGTTLITLFSGEGVVNFSDISPVQYAVAVIGAVLAAASVIQAALTDSPVQAISRQAGYVRPSLCFALGATLLLAVSLGALPGCASAPKPLHTIAAMSEAIEQVAIQIDLAQKEGRITNEREDKLLGDLMNLNQQLRLAASLSGDYQQKDLQSINDQLIQLRAELAKESK